jgi:uncharacterized membrane protein
MMSFAALARRPYFFDHGHPFLRMLIVMAVLAAVVVLVVWLVHRFVGLGRYGPRGFGRPGFAPPGFGPAGSARPDTALEHLRVRYARGEIDRDASLQTARDLGAPDIGNEPPAPAPPAAPPSPPAA